MMITSSAQTPQKSPQGARRGRVHLSFAASSFPTGAFDRGHQNHPLKPVLHIEMTNEQREFLNLCVKPAIGGFIEASYILNIHVDGLVYLEKIGELKALANPPPGAQRYFSISYLFKLAQDDRWLTRAIRLIRENSRRLNQTKKGRRVVGAGQNPHPPETNARPLTAIQRALQIARTACPFNNRGESGRR